MSSRSNGKAAPPPLTPCDMLALARQQLAALVGGQAIVEVETPQLGRVVYSKGDAGQLQRIIDGLAADCAALLGQPCPGRRRPISIEAWP